MSLTVSAECFSVRGFESPVGYPTLEPALMPRLCQLSTSAGYLGLLAISSLVLACAHSSVGSRGNDSDGRDGTAADHGAGKVHSASLTVGGTTREFSYYVPVVGGEEERAIVIYLHGHGDSMGHILGNGLVPSASSKWMDLADREGFIVVYPLGLKGDGRRAKTGWNDCRTDAPGNPDSDDVGLIQGLVDFAANELDGDRRRVYVTGMSNGGHMAMRVAMEMSGSVAAVAPVVALLPRDRGCSPPTQPVPILLMYGTDDPIAPFEGGAMAGGRGHVLSARETVATWVDWNQLGGTTETTFELPDLATSDDSTITVIERDTGSGGSAVIAYEVRGGGHTEPSRSAKLGRLLKRIQGNQNHDIESAEAIWAFFKTRSR